MRLAVWRGTEGSNPLPSSGESPANLRVFAGSGAREVGRLADDHLFLRQAPNNPSAASCCWKHAKQRGVNRAHRPGSSTVNRSRPPRAVGRAVTMRPRRSKAASAVCHEHIARVRRCGANTLRGTCSSIPAASQQGHWLRPQRRERSPQRMVSHTIDVWRSQLAVKGLAGAPNRGSSCDRHERSVERHWAVG